jgi:hypothetical protein
MNPDKALEEAVDLGDFDDMEGSYCREAALLSGKGPEKKRPDVMTPEEEKRMLEDYSSRFAAEAIAHLPK